MSTTRSSGAWPPATPGWLGTGGLEVGGETWLTDIVAPYGRHDAMIKDLKEHVFPKREVAFLGVEDGKAVVKRV